MDRAALTEESIHALGVLFKAAVREAVSALSVTDLAGIERRLHVVGRPILGQVVERVRALRAAHEGQERQPCAHYGAAMRRVEAQRRTHQITARTLPLATDTAPHEPGEGPPQMSPAPPQSDTPSCHTGLCDAACVVRSHVPLTA